MPDCCDPRPYEKLFDRGEAERRLRRYRRRGLDGMATRISHFLVERGVADKSVLEIGGGVGDFQVELLKAGAAGGVNIELSDGYEEAARELMIGEGLAGRLDRRLGDFVEIQDDFEAADIVILNRVLCCYPWLDRLMGAALGKAGWLVAIAVPRDRWLSRLMVSIANGVSRLRGDGFRAFVHPTSRIVTLAAESGLTPVFSETGFFWRGIVFERGS